MVEDTNPPRVRPRSTLFRFVLVVMLLSVSATIGLLAWLSTVEPKPAAHRNLDFPRLTPVAAEDSGWLGIYKLRTASEQIEFRTGGDYRERLTPIDQMGKEDEDYEMIDGPRFPPREERPGTWTRSGSGVVAQPKGLAIAREFELGRLDGEYVLLSEFNKWRRVPDAAATSSSR